MDDIERRFHETWLGHVQPIEGLVFSIPVLVAAGIARRHGDLQTVLHELTTVVEVPSLALVASGRRGRERAREDAELLGTRRYHDLPQLLERLLELPPDYFDRGDTLPDALFAAVQEAHQILRPTLALKRGTWRSRNEQKRTEAAQSETAGSLVPDADTPAARAGRDYLLLIWELPDALDLDTPETVTGDWEYPPVRKFDRLLRACRVPVGLLTNGRVIRLLFSPHGEASSWLTFDLTAMAAPGGQTLLDAFVMLFDERRLFDRHENSLLELLERSRAYQVEVTTQLAEQCLEAMEVLLDGFVEASERGDDGWLSGALKSDDDHLYRGLLTVLLRLVFLLFAEDRALMPVDHPHYARNLSVLGLYQALREAADRHPDTMGQRFGAWPRLLTLFRAIHRGVDHTFASGRLRLPPRHGHLFDPDRFPFLEGRMQGDVVSLADAKARASVRPPALSDATLLAVLEKLLIVKGERQSYRTLQVEQIGSVYEGMLGYHVQRAVGEAVCVKPHGVWIGATELLEVEPGQRPRWLEDRGLPRAQAKAVAQALGKALADPAGTAKALAALDEIAVRGRPHAAQGQLILQPGPERRRTSTHYTPRTLAERIVVRTLEPLLAAMGGEPKAEQLLALKVCDPAMGSGAFLVSACRFLGDQLVAAWTREGRLHDIVAAHDDPVMHARRVVAMRCLYGVDKNPDAVDLGKLSLWLETLAKDLPFTFVDHALKCGDSLVGLDLAQIRAMHWDAKAAGKSTQIEIVQKLVDEAVKEAQTLRDELLALAEQASVDAMSQREELHARAQKAMEPVRLLADLVVAAFFAEEKPKAREQARARVSDLVQVWLGKRDEDGRLLRVPAELATMQAEIRERVRPFHWFVEFPEVFSDERADPLQGGVVNKGAWMDAFVGNPPFMGRNAIIAVLSPAYLDWLMHMHSGAIANSDMSAHFFRRCGRLLGTHGVAGLIATNTISQGDTRETGLKPLLREGFSILDAISRLPWPGDAAVVVSSVILGRGTVTNARCTLDDKIVQFIDSRLTPNRERADPVRLAINQGIGYNGVFVLGDGFFLDTAEGEAIIQQDPRYRLVIKPYVSGEFTNSSPTLGYDRMIIDFGAMTLDEARAYPIALRRLEELVLPVRATNDRATYRDYWWRLAERRPGMQAKVSGLAKILVTVQKARHMIFSFQPSGRVLSQSLRVFVFDDFGTFGVLQSRVHECWAWSFGATIKTDLSYNVSGCFETFARPHTQADIRTIAESVYEARATYMVKTDQGLTKAYNALKDPDCHDPAIETLRELHVELDRAVLAAYGWSDIEPPPYTTPQTREEKAIRQAFEDEVIDRLFALNAERAADERKTGGEEEVAEPEPKAVTPKPHKDDRTILMPFAEEPAKDED